jgi:hypothetical protein
LYGNFVQNKKNNRNRLKKDGKGIDIMIENVTNMTGAVLGAASGIDPMGNFYASLMGGLPTFALIGVVLVLPHVTGFNAYHRMKKEIKAMAKVTGKPVIVMQHHDAGLFGQMIMPSTVVKLAKALRKCGGKDVDLVLHTLGGDLFSSVQIAKMIRDYPGDVNVMIPKYAMSGGTMISIACDSIMMGRVASLGPVDPQIGSLFSSYSSKAWQRILKVKGKKADDKSIATSLLAKQCDDMVRVEVEKIAKRKDIDFLFKGDVVHSMQFDADFMRGHGFKVQELTDDRPDKIIECLDSKHEVVVCAKKGKRRKISKM